MSPERAQSLADAEADDLRLHVALCNERHKQIASTLGHIETRQKRIEIAAYVIAGALGLGGFVGVNQVSRLGDNVAQAVLEHAAPGAAAAMPRPQIPGVPR